MNVLIIDNGDPTREHFDQILVQQGAKVLRVANDEIEIDEVREYAATHIVISTGDEAPADAGITLPLIRELGIDYPMLGIGLGMVCIAAAFGVRAMRATTPPRAMEHEAKSILVGLPSPCPVADDPALAFEFRVPPSGLWTTAWSDDNQIMGVAHTTLPLVGILALPAAPDHVRHLIGTFLALPPHE